MARKAWLAERATRRRVRPGASSHRSRPVQLAPFGRGGQRRKPLRLRMASRRSLHQTHDPLNEPGRDRANRIAGADKEFQMSRAAWDQPPTFSPVINVTTRNERSPAL